MNDRSTRSRRTACGALTILGVTSALALAQPANPPQKTPQPQQKPYEAKGTDQGTATLTARLVDMEQLAAHGAAGVEVQVTGVKLIDPGSVGEKPAPGQGHLHYQIDDGPVIATTATDLMFHQLKPGPHKLKVMLAANDHSPLGPSQELSITGDMKGAEGKNASGEHGSDHEKGHGKGDEKEDDGEHTAQAKEKPAMTAKLVDEAKNTARQSMTVEVVVTDANIVDPLKGMESGRSEGLHLHYALDDGPVVATSMKKLSYHGLRSGSHKLRVCLADDHHKPVGTEQTLQIMVP
jgi:hypothetical protein